MTLKDILKGKKDLITKGITFIDSGDRSEAVSYHDLYELAAHALGFLQNKEVRAGDELVFQVDSNRDFIVLFWACMLGGIIPVPVAIGQHDEHKQKLFNIWSVLARPRLISSPKRLDGLKAFAEMNNLLHVFSMMAANNVDVEEITRWEEDGQEFESTEDDIAFIQFSSGSTGSPKGVILTHKNLITNISDITTAARYYQGDSMLSWMPLTHDMGLIGFHLNPLFVGMDHFLLPPGLFIRNPKIWLRKASEHRITILCSPNFGYQYILKHTDQTEQLNIDLSSVRIFYNGAEPVSDDVCREFLERFSKYGLSTSCLYPVYGLAEASLAVSIPIQPGIISVHLDRNKLNIGDCIEVVTRLDCGASFVSVGRPVASCLLRITDDTDQVVDENVIGHVQIKGPNVTQGYYRNPDETLNTITSDGWLKTGDLGFLRDQEVYITGRVKDIFFVNGQNFYPHDLERIAATVPGVELNKVVIVGFSNEGKEETAAFVFHRGTLREFSPVAYDIAATINRAVGLRLDHVLPVTDIPRTTSGKLRRFNFIERFLQGEFSETAAELTVLAQKEGVSIQHGIDEIETTIARLWKEILCNNNVSPTDSFFEAGGNSLKAAEFSMAFQREFGMSLPFEMLYDNSSIKALALVARQAEAKQGEKLHSISADISPGTVYRATDGQRSLYYYCELNKTSTVYNVPVVFQLNGIVDRRRLESCLQQLVARHDSLRMSFTFDGEPVFEVSKTSAITLDICEYLGPDIEGFLRSLVLPFDLHEPPLCRAVLVNVSEQHNFLFLDFHHIVVDGISISIFVEELLSLYGGGQLPAVNTTYAAYTNWYHENFLPTVLKQQDFWKSELSGDLPKLALPHDYQRPRTFATAGARVELPIDQPTWKKIRTLSADYKCTPFAVLLAFYNIILAKLSNQEEILVSVPVAGRRHLDVRRTIGMFVNSIVLRTTVDGGMSFAQFLSGLREKLFRLYDHQDFPVERMIEIAGEERDMSRNPIFDATFVYQGFGIDDVIVDECSFLRHVFHNGTSKYDISFEVNEYGDHVKCFIEYPISLFEARTVERFAAHFSNLIITTLDNPENRISDLQLLSANEYSTHVLAFNETKRSYPADIPIHVLIEKCGSENPDKIAVECNGIELRYDELIERADHVASLLRSCGIGPDVVVAVYQERSVEFVVSIIGILKAGGAFLPIDVSLPVDRISYILADSSCNVIITASKVAGLLSPGASTVICIDTLAFSGKPSRCRNVNAASDLAYVIYTSGTTGRPKGVMIEHCSLVNYISWAAEEYVAGAGGDFPLFTSISFDLTITSIFTPLITGNRIVIYSDDASDVLLRRIVADNNVDIVKLTPSHLRLLHGLNLPVAERGNRILKFIVGGEQLDSLLAAAVQDRFKGAVIFNEYGPTETTVGCMIHRFDRTADGGVVPIGIPAANTNIFVVDKYLKPVPIGVTGEIYISGAGVARGYVGDKELEAGKFISSGFEMGCRMYRTGDMAKRLPSGKIEYIGRTDRQLKINGYRIDLSEIEACIQGWPAIEKFFVTTREHTNGQDSVIVYYTSSEDHNVFSLRSYLAEKLPAFMMPAQILKVDNIPLTSNGKVDVRSLRKMPARDEQVLVVISKETDALTSALIALWQEVLDEENISAGSNFFFLGGDSIKAVQISARLSSQGIILNPKDILLYQTIGQIRPHMSAAKGYVYKQGHATGEMKPLPIMSWFLQWQFETPGHFNQSVLLELCSDADFPFKEIFSRLVDHHDGLRLNYDRERNVVFYNDKHLGAMFYVPRIEVYEETFISDEARAMKKFDLANDLLIRAAVFKRQGAPDLLLITAHHLVIDGISWRILLEDMYRLCRAIKTGDTVQLGAKTASVVDWHDQLVAEGFAMNDLTAHTAEDVILPLESESDDWRSVNRRSAVGYLDAEVTRRLVKEGHRSYRAGAATILVTGLVRVLKQQMGLDRCVIDMESHGRHLDSVDVSRTVGWFTSLYPVEFAAPSCSVRDQLMYVKEQLNNISKKGFAYCASKYFGKYPGPAKRSEVMFNYLGHFESELNNGLFSLSHCDHGPESADENVMTAKLEVVCMLYKGKLKVEMFYNKNTFNESAMRELRDGFLDELRMIMDHISNEREVHFTPSDFDAVSLKQEELDALFS
jgi:amino acid adenylation domain-containing protein/non-ribosomal peptide synthase protein (TIGR01720 family)